MKHRMKLSERLVLYTVVTIVIVSLLTIIYPILVTGGVLR